MPETIDISERKAYNMGKEYILSPEQIRAIESAAKKADRIELIPCKDGFKITAIQRKEVK